MNLTFENITAILGALTGVSGFIFGYREKKIANRSKRLDNITKLEKFLDDDITQIHKVNDILKFRLKEQEKEIKRLRNEAAN